MYCQDRWEREYFDDREEPQRITPREPTWFICLVLLAGPLVTALISVDVAIHIQNMGMYLKYAGG